MSPRRSAAALVAALSLLTPLGLVSGVSATPSAQIPGAAAGSSTPPPRRITISAVSNRPDLVSGGDVRIAIEPARHLRRSRVHVHLNGRDVSRRFALRRDGGYEAYLTGLKRGRNVLTATTPGFYGRLVVTNHPSGGPIFSGPQTRHYRCQAGARDRRCNQPPKYSYVYRSSNPFLSGLRPYHPAHPRARWPRPGPTRA